MPQTHIRPDVVALLADVDWHGRRDEPPQRRDGRPFTLAEQRLISTITPEEGAAARQQIRRENQWLDEVDAMRDDFVALVRKYLDQLPKNAVVADAISIMTDEDYAEYERLVPIVTAQDTLEYRATHRNPTEHLTRHTED
ncbi:hypothetical protein ACFUN8_11975 [Streptomyces sp. NPDC057307]|uniref:hypothetical protein n=1 Tax=Streptomyces sp. NPDC057307 TaxID=3346096 RepID=UPI00362EC372